MRTSINIDDELLEQVRQHNDKHPESQIIISVVCRAAILHALKGGRNGNK